jgi:hypothetical protein
MITQEIPDDAIGALMGSYYKIGAHGFAYYWSGGEWKKSQHHAAIVKAALSKAKNKFNIHNGGL